MGHLNALSAGEAARRIAAGEITSEALVGDCLARIEEREADVGAFSHLAAEAALAEARLRDRAAPAGPLHGVPVAVKDIIDTADMPTTWGSPIYAGHRPVRDASAVQLFRDAGAIIIGKTVTTEFACFTPGKTANPHNLSHTPGGSSSGSAAAVADRMVPMAFGSQTAASVIRPAAYCGVVGYKATHGSFSLEGIMGLAPSLDTLGMFVRAPEDLMLMREVLCGDRPASPGRSRPPRIGFMRGPHWMEGSADMRHACERAAEILASAGAEVEDLAHPPGFEDFTAHHKTVMGYETARSRCFEYRRHRAHISDRFATLMEEGASVSYGAYHAALQAGLDMARRIEDVLSGHDCLLTPSAPGEAPEGLSATGDPLFSRAWTLLRGPCIGLPCGTGPRGLPLGVQLIGRRGGDMALIATAGWALSHLSPDGVPLPQEGAGSGAREIPAPPAGAGRPG